MNSIPSLADIKPGEKAVVKALALSGPARRRLLDLGLVEGTLAECLGQSPAGDPKAYRIRGAVIALRSRDCKQILIDEKERIHGIDK